MVYHEGALWFIMRVHCGLSLGSIVVYHEGTLWYTMREHCGLL